jgi:hypothetical protein
MLWNPLSTRHLHARKLRHVKSLEIALAGVDCIANRAATSLERLHQWRPHHFVSVKVDHAA